MAVLSRVATCLWFADGNGHEAAFASCALMPGDRITTVMPGPDGGTAAVAFELMGTPHQALNGGPRHRLSEAASIVVGTEDQAETDRHWDAPCEGGTAPACGWLTDRFGVSWQIAPKGLWEMTSSPDREAGGRAFRATEGMVRSDVAQVRAAFEGRA